MSKPKKNSRAKGQRAERELVKLFAKWWGSEFYRTPGSGAFATRGFDPEKYAGDILTDDPDFPFCVESKNGEGWHLEQLLTSDKSLIDKWWLQAVGETPTSKLPLLVFTRNRQPFFFMMHELAPLAGIYLWSLGDGRVVGLLSEFVKTDPAVWRALYEQPI